MKALMTTLGALALTAGIAAAQSATKPGDTTVNQGEGTQQTTAGPSKDATPTQRSQSRTRTDLGASRIDKRGTDQTYNTGPTGASVGKDTPDSYKPSADQTAAGGGNRENGARGTGVATGFVAAGIGLALLGLFVRRRNRRGHYDDDEFNRPGGVGRGGRDDLGTRL